MEHLLVIHGPDRQVASFETHGEAFAAWEAVVKHVEGEGERAIMYGVRDSEDPRWANAPQVGPEYRDIQKIAREAARRYRTKVIGKHATRLVRSAPQGTSIEKVMRDLMADLQRVEGIKIDRWVAQDAVKARVLIGRIWNGYYSGRDRRPGVWFPKSEGPLVAWRGPNGEQLAQSTLSYKPGFRRA